MDQAERYAARQRREDEADAFAEFMMRSIRAFFEGKAELVIDIEDDKFRFVRFVKDGD